jgi:hypothetical protein
LEYLGLNDLNDLPGMEELEALLEKEEYGEETGNDIAKPEQDSAEPSQATTETANDDAGPSGEGMETTSDGVESADDSTESIDDVTAPEESPPQDIEPLYTRITRNEFNRQPEEKSSNSEQELPDEEKKYSE